MPFYNFREGERVALLEGPTRNPFARPWKYGIIERIILGDPQTLMVQLEHTHETVEVLRDGNITIIPVDDG